MLKLPHDSAYSSINKQQHYSGYSETIPDTADDVSGGRRKEEERLEVGAAVVEAEHRGQVQPTGGQRGRDEVLEQREQCKVRCGATSAQARPSAQTHDRRGNRCEC